MAVESKSLIVVSPGGSHQKLKTDAIIVAIDDPSIFPRIKILARRQLFLNQLQGGKQDGPAW